MQACYDWVRPGARTAVTKAEQAELLPRIQAEENQQALEEAQAHLNALRKTQELKDKVDAAEIRTVASQLLWTLVMALVVPVIATSTS